MNAVKLVRPPEPVYKFKEAAHIPKGVTPEAVIEERERIVEIHGYASARVAADAVLAEPESFPSLRAFAPDDADAALRLCVERGVRYAFGAIVQVEIVDGPHQVQRPIEIRVFHAVPVKDFNDLSYEPITIIRRTPEQRSFLISELRKDAAAFSQKLENTLAELEAVIE